MRPGGDALGVLPHLGDVEGCKMRNRMIVEHLPLAHISQKCRTRGPDDQNYLRDASEQSCASVSPLPSSGNWATGTHLLDWDSHPPDVQPAKNKTDVKINLVHDPSLHGVYRGFQTWLTGEN